MISRSKQLGFVLSVATVLALASAALYPFSQAAATQRNLVKAREYVQVIRPAILGNPLFRAVVLAVSPEQGGTVVVSGSVQSGKDLSELRSFLRQSGPPVDLVWAVTVDEEPTTENSM